MANFQIGQPVHVPCRIQPGAFPNERLVTIETGAGVISGFVRSEYVVETDHSRGYIKGTVTAITSSVVTVRLPGSFFTVASGVTALPAEWARTNLEPVEVD